MPPINNPDASPHSRPLVETRWINHPKNTPYMGSSNSAVNNTSVNVPESWEQFTLKDGEKKIEEKIDTRTQSTSIFTINKEDHTLCNMLRSKLLENSHVTFAAYKVPHPLFATNELRVSTDGTITPKEAVLAASKELVKELEVLKSRFKVAYDLTKMSQQADPNA